MALCVRLWQFLPTENLEKIPTIVLNLKICCLLDLQSLLVFFFQILKKKHNTSSFLNKCHFDIFNTD